MAIKTPTAQCESTCSPWTAAAALLLNSILTNYSEGNIHPAKTDFTITILRCKSHTKNCISSFIFPRCVVSAQYIYWNLATKPVINYPHFLSFIRTLQRKCVMSSELTASQGHVSFVNGVTLRDKCMMLAGAVTSQKKKLRTWWPDTEQCGSVCVCVCVCVCVAVDITLVNHYFALIVIVCDAFVSLHVCISCTV